MLKRGQQRLYLHPGVEGDPSDENETPSDVEQDDELGRLLKVSTSCQTWFWENLMRCNCASG